MRAARLAARGVALVQVPDRRVAELVQRDVEQTRVDVAALPGLLRAQDAGEQADRAGRAGHEVDHRGADARGRRRRARRSGP